MDWIVVLVIGVFAGTLGGIVGFGTSILLLPPLVIVFGPKEAVPIMAIVALMANLSRVAVWWREVDWKVCGVYSLTAVPFAALGAATLLSLPPRVIEVSLGLFFLASIPLRRWLVGFRVRLWQMALVGAGIGFLTGIVASTGPINTPFFLAYGLVKGAFLSTEAMGSLGIFFSKAIVFRQGGALPWDVIVKGLIIGSTVTAGSFIAKRFVLRLDPAHFRLLIEVVMCVAGVSMLATALA